MLDILIIVTAVFSIFYFILAVCQIVHIVWSKFHFDKDWQQRPDVDDGERHQPTDRELETCYGRLVPWICLGTIALVLLVIVFPVLHI